MSLNKFIIEKQASDFRADNGLGLLDPIRLRSLLLKLNVLTIFRPLSVNFSGMCEKYDSGHYFILINSNNSKGRQHFTIAHELYHLFIEPNPKPHRCNPGVLKFSYEKEADMFASLVLMPEAGLSAIIPNSELDMDKISIATVIKLEQYFSVSRAALLYRLKDVGLISSSKRAALSDLPIISTARSYGYDTSLYRPANENLVIGDYGEKARKLFDDGVISEGHYLELLKTIILDGTEEDEDSAGC